MDNVLLCQDLARCSKPRSTVKGSLLKIDLKKAYDSVEWGFIEEMLRAMDFPVGAAVFLLSTH